MRGGEVCVSFGWLAVFLVLSRGGGLMAVCVWVVWRVRLVVVSLRFLFGSGLVMFGYR